MSTPTNLQRAVAATILDHPFFASLLLRMELQENKAIPTARTNGKWIQYNPDYFAEKTVNEIVFILCHEVLHVANLHHLRRGARDLKRFNIAGDYAINWILAQAKMQAPAGALIDKQYANMSAEQVYDKLEQEEPPKSDDEQGDEQGDGKGDSGDSGGSGNEQGDKQESCGDPGGCGEFCDGEDEDGNTLSEAERQREAAEISVAVQQAAQAAKMQGKLPGSLQRLVDELSHPILDWREILRTFVDHTARNDYSWNQPNRRHIGNGLYLPSLRSSELKPIVLAVDTSGSIGQHELNQFQAELNDILDSYPCTVHVVYCDYQIAGTQEFTSDEYPVKLEAKGGGGTSLCPPFKWAEENAPTAGCLIYLTDLYGDSPKDDPGIPTLWVSTTKDSDIPDYYRPKFGQVATLQ